MKGKEKEKGGPGGKGGKTAVIVTVVKSTKLDDILSSTGSILPNEEVEIRSEIAGRIILLNIKEGDNIQKGTVLLRINDDELQARLKKLGFNIFDYFSTIFAQSLQDKNLLQNLTKNNIFYEGNLKSQNSKLAVDEQKLQDLKMAMKDGSWVYSDSAQEELN